MTKILLISLLAACAGAITIPMLGKVLGFHQTAVYACTIDQDGNDDCQGDEPSIKRRLKK
jgi:hypothetical protein